MSEISTRYSRGVRVFMWEGWIVVMGENEFQYLGIIVIVIGWVNLHTIDRTYFTDLVIIILQLCYQK